MEPFGFFDFVKLEKHAKVGITDSGLCSEEYCILHVPCVIVRNETERPEVIEVGGAVISGIDAKSILDSVEVLSKITKRNWQIPEGYDYNNVSDRVVNYILSKSY
jgi:UDP-N-acetylglucosamine 2-epimerase (non-hydrolysing)